MIPATADRSLRGQGTVTAAVSAGHGAGAAATTRVEVPAADRAEQGDPGGQRDAQAGRVGAGRVDHLVDGAPQRCRWRQVQAQPLRRPAQPFEVPAHAERPATDDLERLEHPVAHGQPVVEHRHDGVAGRDHPPIHPHHGVVHRAIRRPGGPASTPLRPAAARRAGEASVRGSPESGDGFTGLGSVGRQCAPTGTPPATASRRRALSSVSAHSPTGVEPQVMPPPVPSAAARPRPRRCGWPR